MVLLALLYRAASVCLGRAHRLGCESTRDVNYASLLEYPESCLSCMSGRRYGSGRCPHRIRIKYWIKDKYDFHSGNQVCLPLIGCIGDEWGLATEDLTHVYGPMWGITPAQPFTQYVPGKVTRHIEKYCWPCQRQLPCAR